MKNRKGKYIKAIAAAAVAVLQAFVLTGCWGKTEIEKRRYIVTLGIDSDNENKSLRENYEVIGSEGDYFVSLGAAGIKNDIGDDSKQQNMTVVNGESIASIRETANRYSDNDIYFGQLKTIVIGKDIIKDNDTFENMIFDIERTEKINTKVIAVIAENTAAEVVQKIMEEGEGNGMYVWNYYKNNDANVDLGEYMDFEHLAKSMRNDEAVIIPQITIEDGITVIDGGSVINRDGYCGEVSSEILDGLKWLEGNAKGEVITSDGVSVRVLSQKTKNKMTDGVYQVEASADCIVENGEISDSSMNQIKTVIKEEMENTMNKAIELNADLFDLSEDGNIDGLNYNITVDIKIRSTGVIK